MSIGIPKCAFVLTILDFLGCQKQISGYDFKNILDDSIHYSSVSYWYVGEKDGYHFIPERWPLPTTSKIYQIPQNEISVLKDLEYTDDRSKWINLKKVIFSL